ncbi:hypothetical protein PFICI_06388 [Pestalotiopsis fici W106-1]|uniref:Uncharacterized protein n=1 Tax=Pestalotiopsis fici (strain W106-1 / CGMCC3.15140) TaxID=1229662 RepID=W3X874_PESFW|nr:uncharacterized protein PFICI_06388 [Pestalotiopsis fici W106-1]ETS81386.1 hypothetical protein PFICI_06388 [Pestalotiopsis fici W106-1]
MRMLSRIGLRSIPASRLVRPRSAYTTPIHNLRLCKPTAPQQAQQQVRAFHYDPHAVVFKLPLKTRLKYMAYGALSLLALGGGIISWRLRGLYGQRDALQDDLKSALHELKAFSDDFVTGFEQARAEGDHRRLGRLTFDLLRHMNLNRATGRLLEGFVDFGELPGLPYDNPRSGHELVPREDTTVLLEQDDDGRIGACFVGVNLELSDVYRGLADPKPEPESDKLLELFSRVGDQIRTWRRQDRLFEDEEGELDLVIIFHFRDWSWAFEYGDGHWNSLSGPGNILATSSTVSKAEEVLEAMAGENRGIFGRGSRP